jgi:hypothetical protein
VSDPSHVNLMDIATFVESRTCDFHSRFSAANEAIAASNITTAH